MNFDSESITTYMSEQDDLQKLLDNLDANEEGYYEYLDEILFNLNNSNKKNKKIKKNELESESQKRERKEKIRKKIEELKEKHRKKAGVQFISDKFSRDIPKNLCNSNNKYANVIWNTQTLENVMKIIEMKLSNTFGRYNQEEKEALLSLENFILLGRSGTGKTFAALHKILLLEMTFCLNSVKDSIKTENFDLRLIFCSSSSILVSECKKYYIFLKKYFQDAVNKVPISKQNIFKPEEIGLILDENKEFEHFHLFDTLTVFLNL